jgi:DNA (cytosine-5)-methyltransferase 1
VAAAVDQNRNALAVYRRNFAHPELPTAIESLPDRWWRALDADLWWMSPPCPPYTGRGAGRDVDDPRARSLLALIGQIAALRPRCVALENVAGFEGSRAHQRLRDTLDQAGYTVRETLLCPTELGLPSRRPRFYVVAGLGEVGAWPARAGERVALADLLDDEPAAALWCEPALVQRYARALHVVEAADARACTACFTSAYGRSPVRSGSYLLTQGGLRRFSPGEILRLLDFPPDFALPPDLPLRSAWPLVGNSVSVRAVRWVLGAVPGLLE